MTRRNAVDWGRRAAGLVAAALLAVVVAGVLPGPARADFTVHTCAGSPAAPWQNGVGGYRGFDALDDMCSAGGGYGFGFGTLSPGQLLGAGIVTPRGEVIAHVATTFHSSPSAGARLQFGYQTATTVLDRPIGDAQAGTSLDVSLPDVSEFYVRVSCFSANQCPFSSGSNVVLGPVTLTMHDTGTPAVSATGGSLSHIGTFRGVQSLVYGASDVGSGVARVTASLGSTVVASTQSACQSFSLSPCPAAASGSLAINTALVPDGTYPVILTAYDASGDPGSAQVGRITVRNHSRTVTLPGPRHRKGAVNTKIETGWRWNGDRTKLTKITFKRLARIAMVTVQCEGGRCPFKTRRSGARRVARLARRLRGTEFRVGERLEITVSQPHLRAERGEVRFRRGRVPLMRRR